MRAGKITNEDKAEVITELRHKYNLNDLLKLTHLPRSTYYYSCKVLAKPDKYRQIKEELSSIYHFHEGRYGYRRIAMEMCKNGYNLNHKTVSRLLHELGLQCRVRIKKYRSYKGEIGKIAPNLLNREFVATKPNEKWVTDVTEISLHGNKLYLSPILDLFNGEIVSYQLEERPLLSMVTKMLDSAFLNLDVKDKPMLHSDQGWQYQHVMYQTMLKNRGIKQSMSRKGNCLDNAVIENFFGLFKSELLYLKTFDSTEHFKNEVKIYMDYYNNIRIKGKLKGLSPIQYREQFSRVA